MFVLEIADENSQAIEATLDDIVYYIVINWNESGQAWEMGVRDSAYNMVICGIRMVPFYPLLRQFKYTEMPDGELVVHDYTLNKSNRIPRDGFVLGRYELVYYTRDELLQVQARNAV